MSCIKKIMYIHSHRKSVSNGIFAMIFERHYMCCLQNLRHFNIGNNASSISSKNFPSETRLIWSVLSFHKFSFCIRNDFI